MNPDVFFENFELLADAPNGVQKLRELILQLAVMGKLVPQDPNDEPASVLLERIKDEKKRLIKEKKLRKEDSLPSIESKDVPFEIPKTWKWVYLRDVGQIVGGGTPTTSQPDYFSEDGVAWLTPADLYNLKEKFVVKGRRDLSELGLQKSSAQLMPAGTVLFSSRAPIGYVAIAATDLATNQGFKSCVPFIMEMNEFIYYFLKYAGKEIDQNASGTTFKEVSGKVMSQVIFPLPPLAEQKRIVSRVDELMSLCDKLETRRQRKQEIQSKLNSAALDRMLSAENQDEFEQHWQHICENFDLLYDNPENVEKLRQAILQLAVQGKLVPQNPEDEPASVLIEQMATDKGRKKNRLNSSKVTDTLDLEFELPKNWKLSRIEEFSLLVTDGEHKTPTRIDRSEVPLVTAKNVRDGYLDLGNTDFVSNETAEKCWKRCNPSHNDILMVCVGATTGRLCLIKNPIKFVLVRSVSLIRVDEKYIYPEYVALSMKSPLLQSQIWGNVKQSAQPCLYLNKIKNLFVPLPPLAEQKRIVKKVEQLMGLCDELEAKLRKEREDSEKLMEAVVKGLLEGEDTEKTELEKPISLQVATIKLK